MKISQGKWILPSFLIVLLLLPALAWAADCFGPKITRLANSSKPLTAQVIANKKLGAEQCQLTLLINGTRIFGESRSALCSAKKNTTVSVKLKTRCCAKQPCPRGEENKILISPWITTLKKFALPFSFGSGQKSAPVKQRPRTSISAPLNLHTKPAPTTTLKAAPPAETKSSTAQPHPATKPAPVPAPQTNLALGSRSTKTMEKSLETGSSLEGAAPGGGTALPSTENGGITENGGSESGSAAMASTAAGNGASPLEKYKVELGVTNEIFRPGPPGQLEVWISDPSFSAGFTEDMATAEKTIAALAPFARVTPEAPDFEVNPKQSICIKIDPTGSKVHFDITPKHTGTFNVGASVLLYETNDCTGAPVPKSAADLEVEVKVNPQGWLKYYLLQLWDVLWEGVLNFWGWLVATIFALLGFLIRKKIKKRFGFNAPEAGPPGD
jgi:hypothetical protein